MTIAEIIKDIMDRLQNLEVILSDAGDVDEDVGELDDENFEIQ